MTAPLQLRQELVSEADPLRILVLEVLRRPSRPAMGLKEIARELADRYDSFELERCLLTLSTQGLVEIAYTSGYCVGFRARPLKPW